MIRSIHLFIGVIFSSRKSVRGSFFKSENLLSKLLIAMKNKHFPVLTIYLKISCYTNCRQGYIFDSYLAFQWFDSFVLTAQLTTEGTTK